MQLRVRDDQRKSRDAHDTERPLDLRSKPADVPTSRIAKFMRVKNMLTAGSATLIMVWFSVSQSVGAAELGTQQVSSSLTNVVKMVDSGVAEDVVVAYIKDSAITKPTAEEIIYLHDAGVPKPVMMALLSKAEADATKPESDDTIKRPTYLIPTPTPLYPAPSVLLGVWSETAPTRVYTQPSTVYVSSPRVAVYERPVYYRPPHCDARPAISFGIILGRDGHQSTARRLGPVGARR